MASVRRKESSISIDININEVELTMTVYNRKVTTLPIKVYFGGLGIENVKTRLQLTYPGKHSLSISDIGDQYAVVLIISLT